MLTGAIQEVANQLNINEGFLGLIVLPIAGNVTEHLTVGGWVVAPPWHVVQLSWLQNAPPSRLQSTCWWGRLV